MSWSPLPHPLHTTATEASWRRARLAEFCMLPLTRQGEKESIGQRRVGHCRDGVATPAAVLPQAGWALHQLDMSHVGSRAHSTKLLKRSLTLVPDGGMLCGQTRG
jgi:hypothetical protein